MGKRRTTRVAKFLLSEPEAAVLADAFEADDRLCALPVSLGEAPGGDGRWQALVYLSGTDDEAEIAALGRIAAATGRTAPEMSVERLPDIDWVAKSLEGLKPVRAGRFLVHGSHDRFRRRANDIAIEIEAGEAFGTGHHGTTAGCLAAIDRLARWRRVSRALDVGTGSGVLAIAVAKAAKAKVIACDIDPVAVRVAQTNARLNGVARYVRTVAAGNLRKRVFAGNAPYDLVAANILAGPLVALAPRITRLVAPGGIVVLSGLLPGQRARIVAAYRGRGMALVRGATLDGWLTLAFTRRARRLKA